MRCVRRINAKIVLLWWSRLDNNSRHLFFPACCRGTTVWNWIRATLASSRVYKGCCLMLFLLSEPFLPDKFSPVVLWAVIAEMFSDVRRLESGSYLLTRCSNVTCRYWRQMDAYFLLNCSPCLPEITCEKFIEIFEDNVVFLLWFVTSRLSFLIWICNKSEAFLCGKLIRRF